MSPPFEMPCRVPGCAVVLTVAASRTPGDVRNAASAHLAGVHPGLGLRERSVLADGMRSAALWGRA